MPQGILPGLGFYVRTPCWTNDGLSDKGPSTTLALLRNANSAQDDRVYVKS